MHKCGASSSGYRTVALDSLCTPMTKGVQEYVGEDPMMAMFGELLGLKEEQDDSSWSRVPWGSSHSFSRRKNFDVVLAVLKNHFILVLVRFILVMAHRNF